MRPPFVMTFALASLGVACSSKGNGAPASADVGVDSSYDLDTAPEDTTPLLPPDAHLDTDNPAQCPHDDPGFGAKEKPCKVDPSILCTYVDRCPLRPSDAGPPFNVYLCHDNGAGARWTLVSADYTPDCPTETPRVGADCPCSPHMLYVACVYGTCEAIDRVYLDCQTADEFQTTWKSTPVSCNPPEVDGGDARDGD